MEFLIGRSLTNNITNLMLHSVIGDAVRAAGIDWLPKHTLECPTAK